MWTWNNAFILMPRANTGKESLYIPEAREDAGFFEARTEKLRHVQAMVAASGFIAPVWIYATKVGPLAAGAQPSSDARGYYVSVGSYF